MTKTKAALLTFGVLSLLGALTIVALLVVSGIEYRQLEDQGLEAPTAPWILTGMQIGALVAGASFVGLVIVLVVRWTSERRRG